MPGNSLLPVCLALNFLNTPSVEWEVLGFTSTLENWLSLSGTDHQIYGLVMDGRLQGVSEEFGPSSFSEVRPLQSNT